MCFKLKKMAAMALVLVFCVTGIGVMAAETTKTETYLQDFSVAQLTHYWRIIGDATVVDGKLVPDPDKDIKLSGLTFNYILRSNDYCDIEFDLKCAAESTASAVNSAYVGLRLEGTGQLPTKNEGLWLLFCNNRISMRSGTWPNVQSMTIPYSFETERRVYIRDNFAKNTVRIYVDNDSGVKTLVATVIIDGKTQKLYGASTVGTPYATNTTDIETPKEGFVKVWNHYNKTVTWDNFKIIKRPYTSSYVKADPLQRRDTYSDTWVATDDLDRTLPVYETVGAPKDKKIGIFYFLWHNSDGYDPENGIDLYDHYKTYCEGGVSAVKEIISKGKLGFAHYWAEPVFGYYKTKDEWIIRKHANMLSAAGIDFLYFDCTNGSSYYITGTKTICEIFRKMRDEGQDTPQIVFCMGDNSQRTVKQFFEFWGYFYELGLYEDLWFKWEGKPLILCRDDDIPEEYKEYFTRRDCWAFNAWTNLNGGVGRWPWLAEYPQIPGKDFDGNIEQMAVAAGFHSNSSKGRSYSNGAQPTAGNEDFEFSLMDTLTPLGLCFSEQWEEALRIDPPLVMVTGWNEWWAGRWETTGTQGKLANTINYADKNGIIHYYVDNFNPEFSRDIEPMNGGFGDNYYYQMINYIRQFRGVRPIPKAEGQKSINISGDFAQWNSVWPEYYDTQYDTAQRDYPSFLGVYQYTNTTGRNDIDIAKVSVDDRSMYFYVRTMEDISREDSNWMYLYIDADKNHKTGWEGYDYVINRARENGKVTIEKNVKDYTWKTVGFGDYRTEGNQLHISVDKSLIGSPQSFDFKWADNSDNEGDIAGFMSYGDVAPDSRFNFRYVSSESKMTFTDGAQNVLNNGAVVMAINKNTAYTSGGKVKVDSSNTGVKPQVIDGSTYVPLRFLGESLGSHVSYNDRTGIATVGAVKVNCRNGEVYMSGEKVAGVHAIVDESRTYVPLRFCAEAFGKTILWDERGIIVISNFETLSEEIFEEFYRKI